MLPTYSFPGLLYLRNLGKLNFKRCFSSHASTSFKALHFTLEYMIHFNFSIL